MRIVIRWFLLGIATLMLFCCLGIAQNSMPTFSIAISAPETAKHGAAVMVNVTVTNVSNSTIHFDGDFPNHGERNFNIDVLDSQGNPAPETVYMKAIRGEDQGPGPTHIVIVGHLVQRDLAPGATWKEEADLTTVFNLEPGTYKVRFSRPDFQDDRMEQVSPKQTHSETKNSPLPSNAQPPPVKPKAVAKSNTITVNIVP